MILASLQFAVPSRAAEISYNRDIRPILSDKCFFCHGPDDEERQADLRLDQLKAAHEYAIVPGKPDESEFIARIVADDADSKMPPSDSGKSLTAEEIQLLQRWVAEGAEYEEYWAYVPPQRSRQGHSHNDSLAELIDVLIEEKLAEANLSAAPVADPATLVRRLSFDLTGLPPTLEMVEKFRSEPTEENYLHLVDDLLSSPHFGERMAMYWLDLVRYADTVGYHGDQDHNISPYRDWVIQAFNANMPFDQFTREQLAGDLLPEPTISQQIATGYNRLLQTSHEGGVQPKEYLAIYAADRVRNLSAVWMGATVGCAQCHNHKYDPYTIQDFYSLAAFFADVDEAQHFKVGSNALPTRRPPEIKVYSEAQQLRLKEIDIELSKLDEGQKEQREKLAAEKAAIEKSARLTMVTQSIEPREMRVLPRGNWLDDSGTVVQPAIPEFMGVINAQNREQANRLDLANWLVDSENGVGGLTARVQVNRLWYLLFGNGLSRTLDDFGGQGEPSSHPELLDELAIAFVESGWDLKEIMKQIVLSETYRRSSFASKELQSIDLENRLFAHQSSFRLPAEMVRDNALAASGLLVDEFGGPSIRPYQPVGYYQHLNFPQRKYKADQNENQYRRGVYMHWQRQFLHPMLRAFDAPTREECTAARSRSNTPLAALVLLNDPTFIESARAFAELTLSQDLDEDKAFIQFAFQRATSRLPAQQEVDILLGILEFNRKHYSQEPEAAKKILGVGLKPASEEVDSAELAAWTMVMRSILNLHEVITRN